MKQPKTPPYYKVFVRDVEVKAYFDFDPGEEQWFDGKAGVGSPGYPPSLELDHVEPAMELTPEEVDAVEQELMGKITEAQNEFWAEYAEAMREE
jgi:hypothetical protein